MPPCNGRGERGERNFLILALVAHFSSGLHSAKNFVIRFNSAIEHIFLARGEEVIYVRAKRYRVFDVIYEDVIYVFNEINKVNIIIENRYVEFHHRVV